MNVPPRNSPQTQLLHLDISLLSALRITKDRSSLEEDLTPFILTKSVLIDGMYSKPMKITGLVMVPSDTSRLLKE